MPTARRPAAWAWLLLAAAGVVFVLWGGEYGWDVLAGKFAGIAIGVLFVAAITQRRSGNR